MAEPALKLAPHPPREVTIAAPAPERSRLRLRFVLLLIVPALAAAAGLYLYLAGGRYISTDNAYVGAQKVLITPDVSGKISRVAVREGERVAAGQPLFEIDAVPFRLAATQAEARVAGVRTDFANVKANLTATERMIELAQQTIKRQAHTPL